MTVKELINKLLDCPMDAPVCVTIPPCVTVVAETEGRADDVKRRGTSGNEVVFVEVGF